MAADTPPPGHVAELPPGAVWRTEALSPLDGRYGAKLAELGHVMGEGGLMQARVDMEVGYLVALSEMPDLGPRSFTPDERQLLDGVSHLSTADVARIKEIERTTNHDVKAVEYFLKERLAETSLGDSLEWIHFGLTSEDVNNIAYGMMLREGVERFVLPAGDRLLADLAEWAHQHADVPMLARTHGQPATPTTVGKEFAVFAERLKKELETMSDLEINVKLNGASGNWAAHRAAYPKVDWMLFTEEFVEATNADEHELFLTANHTTTQIEPHDSYVALFHSIKRINGITRDLSQDMWRYISDGWLVQKPKEGEIGSSAMPHKVNPIDWENAEGNTTMSDALCDMFASKLPVSRLQRDLSDSTVERNFGAAFGYALLALENARKGLGKCSVNEVAVRQAVTDHPEVLAEAYQTILRREGVEKPYELLKDLTRGQAPSLAVMHEFVGTLPVSEKVKTELRALTPESYVGYAPEIARSVAAKRHN